MNDIKIAQTNYPVIDLIKNRWSARSFSEQPVNQDQLNTIIEAGTWAFSANNEQPWRIISALKGEERFQKILSCLMPGNTPWAKNAAGLIATFTKSTFDKEGNPPNAAAEHDLGAFNANMVLQALSMNIYAHPMGGFDKIKIKELFSLDKNLTPVAVIAFGFLDDPNKLEEPYKSRETSARSRRSIKEITL